MKSFFVLFTKMQSAFFLMLISSAFSQYSPNYAQGHAGIVHLFEWHWNTIAKECEDFLGPNKFGGVQVRTIKRYSVITLRLHEHSKLTNFGLQTAKSVYLFSLHQGQEFLKS